MERTGERYTAARRHLLEPEPKRDAETPPIGERISAEAFAERTGRTWPEWFVILDHWGAAERPHAEIARYLNEEHGVPGWWAQTVTVGYEQARGLRAKYQRPDGYSISASKTIGVPVERLFDAVLRLPGLRLRTSQPHRSARFDWEDGRTRVNVGFTTKGESRSTVGIAHERLTDADEAAQMKEMWRQRLVELKRVLEEPREVS